MNDLVEDTKRYWRELDALEQAYERGELSIEEVDSRVDQLMRDLGEQRRRSWNFFFSNLINLIWDEKLTVFIFSVAILLVYTWIIGRF